MSVTMPQLIMLNHAAWVSRKNSDKRFEAKRAKEKREGPPIVSTPEEVQHQDEVNSMTPSQLSKYFGSFE